MSAESTLNTRIDEFLRDIGEHFEAVQFLGSFSDDEGATISVYRGKGNWHIRTGMARDFVERDSLQKMARYLDQNL